MPKIRPIAVLLLLIAAAGCQRTSKDQPQAGSNQGSATASAAGSGSAGKAAAGSQGSAQGSASSGSGSAAAPPAKDIDSKDILGRAETTPEVQVKHVLIGWKDLAAAYHGRLDPRAAKRSNDEAATLAQDIAGKLKANPDSIDALIKESSEDPGSLTGEPYTVKADSPFVPEFKNLAIRLKEKEVGIVKTNFGYHVMIRVLPPPPDPLESADIMARPPESGSVKIQQVLIGWNETRISKSGAGDPRAKERTKADADKRAKEVLDKARGGADMAKLMKEYSEDPTSKDSARVDEITADMQVAPMFEPFQKLAVRLKLNEVGLVKTQLGWHIVKRVPPPPPDPLESAAILKREPVTEAAKVKHILLGWTAVHGTDPRGEKRDRATLEKLVHATVAKLVKGAKIEPLMSELSEDPGSAKSGTSYDVSPTAGLVAPFKNLSLRLKVGEVGVVRTDFGIHIIQRTE